MIEDINITEDADLLLSKVDMELIFKKLPRKDRDMLHFWLIGGYSMDNIAKIIKRRYPNEENLTGKLVGIKIQAIINKIRLIIRQNR